ncbi:MAG: LuxR C-terminal-related transcriptional regulator [Chloroflexota bacterium]
MSDESAFPPTTTKSSPPHRVDERYQLRAWVGEDDLSVVYQAQDQVQDQVVFVRLLKPAPDFMTAPSSVSSSDDRVAAMHLAEFAPSQTMTLLDVGYAQGWYYLVLQPVASDELPVSPMIDVGELLERERKRWADLIEKQVIDSLNLLLAQANTYEQTLDGHPTARMTVSVLASLAQQTVQQARQLSDQLKPTLLDTLGFVPALEALIQQVSRTTHHEINVVLDHSQARLPSAIELALFRVTQTIIDRLTATPSAQAPLSPLSIHFIQRADQISLTFLHPPTATPGLTIEDADWSQIESLGGMIEITNRSDRQTSIDIDFQIKQAPDLTPRELTVLQLLAEGLSNKEIAHKLAIKPRTVNFHLDNLYTKLGVHSRTEAVMQAVQQGWLDMSG